MGALCIVKKRLISIALVAALVFALLPAAAPIAALAYDFGAESVTVTDAATVGSLTGLDGHTVTVTGTGSLTNWNWLHNGTIIVQPGGTLISDIGDGTTTTVQNAVMEITLGTVTSLADWHADVTLTATPSSAGKVTFSNAHATNENVNLSQMSITIATDSSITIVGDSNKPLLVSDVKVASGSSLTLDADVTITDSRHSADGEVIVGGDPLGVFAIESGGSVTVASGASLIATPGSLTSLGRIEVLGNGQIEGIDDLSNLGELYFQLILHLNDGDVEGGPPEEYKYGEPAQLPAAGTQTSQISRANSTFAGWFGNAALTGATISYIPATATGLQQFWAGWYGISEDHSVSLTDRHRAFSAYVGYTNVDTHTVTLTNMGNLPTGTIDVVLSGASATSFDLSLTSSIASIAPGSSASFTVTPNHGLAIGTYTAIVTISGVNFAAELFTVSFVVTEEPIYSIELTPATAYVFATATSGYGAQPVHTVTVHNDGNQPTGNLNVTLTGANAASFNRSPASINLAVGSSTSFTIEPNIGLTVGTYSATVTVSGSNGISESFQVSFAVTPVSEFGIELQPELDKVFDPLPEGYAQGALDLLIHPVTVLNTGNQPTGPLTVALSGANSLSFTVTPSDILDIPVGSTSSFTVVPNLGLSAGTYTAIITVSGGNGISESFDVHFVVMIPVTIATATQIGGVSGAADSTDIEIEFNQAVEGLAANHIHITPTTGATPPGDVTVGTLTGLGAEYTIQLNSVIAQGEVTISIDNFGPPGGHVYHVSDPANVTVYKDTRAPVTFTAEQEGGTDGSVDSTGIRIVFDPAVTGFDVSHITITSGSGQVTYGSLTSLPGGDVYILELTSVLAQGDITISIADFGLYTIEPPAQRTVQVFKDTRTPVYFTATQVGGSLGTDDSTDIEIVFDEPVSGLEARHITITDDVGKVTITWQIDPSSGIGTTFKIPIRSVEAQGTITVGVSDFGTFRVETLPQQVMVYRDQDAKRASVGSQVGSLTAGTAGSVTFNLTTENFDPGSSITLSYEGQPPQPPGISIEPNTTTGNSMDVTIRTTSGTPAGSYQYSFIVTDDAGGTAKTNTFTIVVISPQTATYTVTVNGSDAPATGAGAYEAGQTVTVSAGYRNNHTFARWSSSEVSFANPNNPTTTFTMPARNVTVSAIWDAIDGGTVLENVTFTAEQVGGTRNSVSSTGILLRFNREVTGLSAGSITIANGTGSAVRGTLSGSGDTYTISLTDVPVQGTVNVSIANFGAFTVTNNPQQAEVFRDTTSRRATVGAQSGRLVAGTWGNATFNLSTENIANGSGIWLNNLNYISDIHLETTRTTGSSTNIVISATDRTPRGSHPLTLTVDGVTSNTFYLVVDTESYWTGGTYSVTVNGSYASQSGAGSYAPGETVTIRAGSRSNFTFNGWSSVSGVFFADEGNLTTTFVMPDRNVTVNANWRAVTGAARRITVASQYGALEAGIAGSVTFRTATDGIPSSSTIRLNNINSVSGITLDTTRTAGSSTIVYIRTTSSTPLGSHPLTLTIDGVTSNTFYLEVRSDPYWQGGSAGTYAVTVNGSYAGVSGAGWYLPGQRVTINAGSRSEHSFNGWTFSGGIILSDTNNPTTTFIMPERSVTVTANWWFSGSGAGAGTGASGAGSSDWARHFVDLAISSGLVPGSLQSNYNQPITRAEFSALVVTLYENLTARTISSYVRFSDVNDMNVSKAAAIGIVNGVGNNQFDPNGQLTREQAAVMLARLAGTLSWTMPEREDRFFDHGNISSWAVESVYQAHGAGIMGGVGDNLFAPQGLFTREQGIVAILRMYNGG